MIEDVRGFQRPRTAQEAVLTELRRRIVEGEFQPGESIRPDLIAGSFGVSRVPVREALKILEGQDLVRYEPHHGYFVYELERTDLAEINLIRQLLETEAIRRSVPSLSDEHFARMRSAMEEMEAVDDSGASAMIAANRRFHFAIFQAAVMPRLEKFIDMAWQHADPYRVPYYSVARNRVGANREHKQILRASIRQDVDAVIRLMDLHRKNAIVGLNRVSAD